LPDIHLDLVFINDVLTKNPKSGWNET
jgi:hypothetical protein